MRLSRFFSGTFVAMLLLALPSVPARAETVKEINVSYVKSPFNLQIMVMKSTKLLEQEFAADGIAVNWHEITSGAKQAEAMAAGSLDIASVINTTSVILANAGGNPVRIIGGVSRPSKTFAIVARKDGPKTIAELKGKMVAGPKGTVLHQTLLAALAKEGMKAGDVQFVSMDLPKARTAMLEGQVDAALLAASLIIKSVEADAHVLTTADGLVSPVLVSAAAADFAARHPDLVARYLKVFHQAMRFIEENKEQGLAIGIAEHGISMEEGRQLFEWSAFTDHLDKRDIASMREDIAFMRENQLMEKDLDPATVCLPAAFME